MQEDTTNTSDWLCHQRAEETEQNQVPAFSNSIIAMSAFYKVAVRLRQTRVAPTVATNPSPAKMPDEGSGTATA